MNWVVMRPVLLSVVKAATGVETAVWKGSKEEAGWSKAGIVAKLSISSGPKSLGCDEERRNSYDADTDTRTKTLCGPRQFTLTVRFETQDGSDEGIAQTYADRLRVRIYRAANNAALRAAEMSVANIMPSQPISVVLQGRALSVVAVDLVMNGVENDVDDTAGAADWIAQMSGVGTLTRDDGTTKTEPVETKRVST